MPTNEQRAQLAAEALAATFRALRGDFDEAAPAADAAAEGGVDTGGAQGLEAVAAASPADPIVPKADLDEVIEILDTWAASSPVAQFGQIAHSLMKVVGSVKDIGAFFA